MTPEELIADLAFQACDDPSALPVLGDALLETGWLPDKGSNGPGWMSSISLHYRIAFLIYGSPLDQSEGKEYPPNKEDWFETNAATPTPTFARALAAALLCRDWQIEPWRKEFSWLSLLPASGEVLDRLAGAIGLQRRQEVLAPDGSPLAEAESDQEFRTRCMAALGFHATANERFFSRSVPDGLMD